jgi:hypothetical protein
MGSKLVALGGAVALALAIPAGAQTHEAHNPPSARNNGYEVSVIGCLMLEKDYRADLNAKKGGPLASGAGQSNEYVLVKAKPAAANGERQTRTEAVATAGQQGDYMLTGKPETELKAALGRQVEVVGIVQPFRANENAKEDRDRLPRLAITAWHPVQDYCPASAK